MSLHVHYDEKCPDCGCPAVFNVETKTNDTWYECENPLCVNGPITEDAQLARFHASLQKKDFAVGDTFWIGSYEFEVKTDDRCDN